MVLKAWPPDQQHQCLPVNLLKAWILKCCKPRPEFPNGLVGKEATQNAGDKGDAGLIAGSGRSPGGGNGNPLQYSCQRNPTDRVWQAAVQRVTEPNLTERLSRNPDQLTQNSGFSPRKLYSNKSSSWFWFTPMFKNHWVKEISPWGRPQQ